MTVMTGAGSATSPPLLALRHDLGMRAEDESSQPMGVCASVNPYRNQKTVELTLTRHP